jgi:hypothetical protein
MRFALLAMSTAASHNALFVLRTSRLLLPPASQHSSCSSECSALRSAESRPPAGRP